MRTWVLLLVGLAATCDVDALDGPHRRTLASTTTTTTSASNLPRAADWSQPTVVPAPSTPSIKTPTPPLPSARRQTILILLLGALSGVADVVCANRYDFFGNMVTGNSIRLALSLADAKWSTAVYFAAIVSGYMTGGTVFASIDWYLNQHHRDDTKAVQSMRALSAMAPASLIAFGLVDILRLVLHDPKWVLPLLAIGFGMINAAVLDATSIVANAVTGHFTKIGVGLANVALRGGSPAVLSQQFVAAFLGSIVVSALVYQWVVAARPSWTRYMPSIASSYAVVYAILFGWYTAPFVRHEWGYLWKQPSAVNATADLSDEEPA